MHLKSIEKEGEQLQKKIMNDLSENTHFPESPGLINQEIARWKRRIRDEEEDSPEQVDALAKRVLREEVTA